MDPSPAARFGHVLIVEDDKLLLRNLQRFASRWSGHVTTASTLRDALAGAFGPIDLLIADVKLPDGCSHCLFQQLLQLEPKPVMVAISGNASPEEAFQLSQLGAHAFLPKPFSTTDLEQCIERAVVRRASQGEGEALGSRGEIERFSERYGLNQRQTRMVELVVRGVSRAELPGILEISENACKRAVRRLLARCGLTRLTDIPQRIIAERLIGPKN